MTEKQKIYDEICRVLTDYEGNGSEEGATAEDLYDMLVKIQSNWEGVITAEDETGKQRTGRKAICAHCKNADKPLNTTSEKVFGSLMCNHCFVFYEPDYSYPTSK